MSLHTTSPRSRRAVLGAALGAAAATVVAAVERPLAVAAADGDVVHQGDTLYGTSTTSFIVESGSALSGITSGPADDAIMGSAIDGVGLSGLTDTGIGVRGQAGSGSGIVGQSETGSGVYGLSTSGIGVDGAGDAAGIGVRGTASSGIGVDGSAGAAGIGVRGWNTQGVGVLGTVSSGTGVRAISMTGTALEVSGKAKFSRSGKSKILAGTSRIDVDLRQKGGLAGTPLIFATLQYYRSGTYVAGVRANYPVAGKFRIYLNRTVRSATYVAWFVVG